MRSCGLQTEAQCAFGLGLALILAVPTPFCCVGSSMDSQQYGMQGWLSSGHGQEVVAACKNPSVKAIAHGLARLGSDYD